MARTYRLGLIRQALNSLMTSLIRAGLGGPSNYLLTTVGRRTGRMRTTPITVLENVDGRWLVSPYGNVGWVYNVRANPEITLQRGNRTETLQRRRGTAGDSRARCSSSTWIRPGSPRPTSMCGSRTRYRRSSRKPASIRCSC